MGLTFAPTDIMTSRSPRVRFIVVAVVAMLAIQLFAVVAGGVVAREASLDAAQRTLQSDGDTTISRILRFLDPPERVVNDTVALIDLEILEEPDRELETYLLTRLASLQYVSSAFVGFADGSMVAVSTDPDVNTRFESSRIDASAPGVVQRTRYGRSFDVLSVSQDTLEGFDVTTRPWFDGASDELIWTDPYLFFDSGLPGITASRAVLVDGAVSHVVGVNVRLSELSSFLDEVALDQGGEAFVVHREHVIGAPSTTPIIFDNGSGDLWLASPVQLGLEGPGDHDVARNGDIQRVEGVDGSDLVLRQDFPSAESTTPWRLIVRVDENTFTAVTNGYQRTMISITVGGALLLGAALVALVRVTRPIADLQLRAERDPLTGLANRRRINEFGSTLVRQLDPGGHLAVLALDLDRFKQVNDTLGHEVGDDVLSLVADELQSLTRSDDLVGRLGGDEFVVAQRVGSREQGIEIASRVLTELNRRLHTAMPDNDLGVTGGLSIGSRGSHTFADLLSEADRSLIAAKSECTGMLRVSERLVAEAL